MEIWGCVPRRRKFTCRVVFVGEERGVTKFMLKIKEIL